MLDDGDNHDNEDDGNEDDDNHDDEGNDDNEKAIMMISTISPLTSSSGLST